MKRRPILLATPHGLCAGVRRAIESVEHAQRLCPAPVYCLHEIVHNRQVVERLRAAGAVFVNRLDEVPEGKCVVFSAHGVGPAVREQARQRRLHVLDATCPFVAKLHGEVRDFAARGYTVLMIGFRGHEEVVGICGEAPERVIVIENREEAEAVTVPDPEKVAVITQTTLSVDEAARVVETLLARFPRLRRPPTDGICRATVNRQEAVKLLARRVKRILVLGSKNSSNTRRLAEVAAANGAESVLVDTARALESVPLDDVDAVGVMAGASTPEDFTQEVIRTLQDRGFGGTEDVTAVEENLRFPLPRELRSGTRDQTASKAGVS